MENKLEEQTLGKKEIFLQLHIIYHLNFFVSNLLKFLFLIFRSPLGELFDHGCDSSTVAFMGIGIFSCFGVSDKTASEVELFFLAVVVFYAFYFSHWEKYTTNVMYLPWAYDISQFVSI